MSDVGEKLVMVEEKAALGDASEENLLWRPQNIEVALLFIFLKPVQHASIGISIPDSL